MLFRSYWELTDVMPLSLDSLFPYIGQINLDFADYENLPTGMNFYVTELDGTPSHSFDPAGNWTTSSDFDWFGVTNYQTQAKLHFVGMLLVGSEGLQFAAECDVVNPFDAQTLNDPSHNTDLAPDKYGPPPVWPGPKPKRSKGLTVFGDGSWELKYKETIDVWSPTPSGSEGSREAWEQCFSSNENALIDDDEGITWNGWCGLSYTVDQDCAFRVMFMLINYARSRQGRSVYSSYSDYLEAIGRNNQSTFEPSLEGFTSDIQKHAAAASHLAGDNEYLKELSEGTVCESISGSTVGSLNSDGSVSNPDSFGNLASALKNGPVMGRYCSYWLTPPMFHAILIRGAYEVYEITETHTYGESGMSTSKSRGLIEKGIYYINPHDRDKIATASTYRKDGDPNKGAVSFARGS